MWETHNLEYNMARFTYRLCQAMAHQISHCIVCFRMVVEPRDQTNGITSMLMSVIPDIAFERSHGKELSYTIPRSKLSMFPGKKEKTQLNLTLMNLGPPMAGPSDLAVSTVVLITGSPRFSKAVIDIS